MLTEESEEDSKPSDEDDDTDAGIKGDSEDINSDDEEDYILHSLMTYERQYQRVEQAFGYLNKEGEYMLRAAILQDTEGEYCLFGAIGKCYGNTKELITMNYKEAMQTMDKEEWDKAKGRMATWR